MYTVFRPSLSYLNLKKQILSNKTSFEGSRNIKKIFLVILNWLNNVVYFHYRTMLLLNQKKKKHNFPNTFNCYLTTRMSTTKTNKTKNGELVFCKLYRIIKFFFLSLLREATFQLKIAANKRNSLAFLLYISKTFYNI